MFGAEASKTDAMVLLDHEHYVGLVRQLMSAWEDLIGAGALVVCDNATARQVPELEQLGDRFSRVCCIGALGTAFPGIEEHPRPAVIDDGERFLVSLGSRGALAIAGALRQSARGAAFEGAWSLNPEHARALLKAVLHLGDGPVVPEAEGTSLTYERAMRVMALHASVLARQSRDEALDKADLFAVLEILKAISAKRRAHDILYVFVEQIAKSIACSRCSIVRVWGEEGTGHVLASHEDASVIDRTIDLQKYPELARALATGSKLIIDDVADHPATRSFADTLSEARIRSLVVVPIVLLDEHIGSLLLRAARPEGGFSQREIGFYEVVCEAASNALQRAHLLESVQIANERLELLAVTDGLTGLYNHRYFVERVEKEVERARRYALPLSCMMIDVDNFKQLNDAYGHLVGDAVLREIAQCCDQCVRKVDVLARYGGEEFVVLMPQTDAEGGHQQAERLRALIANHKFRELPADSRVTVSIGVSTYLRPTMERPDDLLRLADDAAYTAKSQGKNQVVTQTHEENHA